MDIDDTVDFLLGRGPGPSASEAAHDDDSYGQPSDRHGGGGGGGQTFAGNAARMYGYVTGGGNSRQQLDAEEYRRSRSQTSTTSIPAYDRICRWAARKAARRQQLEAVHEEQVMAECTFQPQRTTFEREVADMSASQLYDNNKAWGYDAFVDRYLEARRRKDEKEQFETTFWHNENRWKGEQTIPEPFELGKTSKPGSIESLNRTYDKIAPAVRHHHQHDPSEIEASSVPTGLFSMQATPTILQHSPMRYARREHNQALSPPSNRRR